MRIIVDLEEHDQMMTSNRSTSRYRPLGLPTRYEVRRMPVEVNGCS